MFEPTAVFAVGEFAEAVGDKRRSEDRKSVVPALEFFQFVPYTDKQELKDAAIVVFQHILIRAF